MAPEPLPEASIADLVEEGELIASSSVRLAVKNLIIMGSLSEGLDYDEQRYTQAARDELLELAREKDDDADRVAQDAAQASERAGRGQSFHDYREVDGAILERRELYARQLASHLRTLADDEGYARGLAMRARESAWDEIATSVKAKLARANAPLDEGYAEHRDERLRLVLGDLRKLERRSAS